MFMDPLGFQKAVDPELRQLHLPLRRIHGPVLITPSAADVSGEAPQFTRLAARHPTAKPPSNPSQGHACHEKSVVACPTSPLNFKPAEF